MKRDALRTTRGTSLIRYAGKWDEPGKKCEYCKSPPTHAIRHSEGMAYVQTCDKHLQKGKDDAAACVPYGGSDPSNIDKIKRIAARVAMPYFHHTDADFQPGDEILPAAERGHDSRFKSVPGYDPNSVYFTDHNSNGAHDFWGKNRYEVEPIGPVSRDPEFEHNKTWYKQDLEDDDVYSDRDVPGYDSYVAPRARVVQRMAAAEDPALEQFGTPDTGNGRWHYPYKEFRQNSYYNDGETGMHEWHIAPTDAPRSEVHTDAHGREHDIHHDPNRVHVEQGEFRPQTVPNDPNAITSWKDLPDPGNMLWRGMSHEEYNQAKDRGYFQSNGSYNLTSGPEDFQHGKTFFSTQLQNAAHYSTGFAPWQHQPTFTRPAHVIGIPDMPDLPRGPLGTDPKSHEVGVPGKIPFDSVTHHWQGNVAAVSPGRVQNDMSHGQWGTPSRSLSPRSDVHWEGGQLPRRTAAEQPWMAEQLRKLMEQHFNQPAHEGWFHASPHDLPEGTKLIPGGADAASKDFYDRGYGSDRGTLQDMGGGREEHVWLSPHMQDAHFWSAVNNAPHIYEVQPHEEPKPWNGTGTDGWVTPAATITRKVHGPDKTSSVLPWSRYGC